MTKHRPKDHLNPQVPPMSRLHLLPIISTIIALIACSNGGGSSSTPQVAGVRLQSAAADFSGHWLGFAACSGETWIYQGYDADGETINDGRSWAVSYGIHYLSDIGTDILYCQQHTATDAAAGSPDDHVWSPETNMDAWAHGHNGEIFEVGYVRQDTAVFVAWQDAGIILPANAPSVGDTWDEITDERPLVGGGQAVETYTAQRRLEAAGVTVETPFGTFDDCYQVAIETVGDVTGTSIDVYEFWSPSAGGMVAMQQSPGSQFGYWRRLARISSDPDWHIPFVVQDIATDG